MACAASIAAPTITWSSPSPTRSCSRAFAHCYAGHHLPVPLTLVLAVLTFVVARGVRRYHRWARRIAIVLEGLVVLGSTLLLLLPVDAMRGPVPLLINLVLPAAVLAILLSRSARAAYRQPAMP